MSKISQNPYAGFLGNFVLPLFSAPSIVCDVDGRFQQLNSLNFHAISAWGIPESWDDPEIMLEDSDEATQIQVWT